MAAAAPAAAVHPHAEREPLFPRVQAAVEAFAAAPRWTLVVFTSVIYRYFLHDPLEWSEEVARR
jgi:TRAP-type C4-dicarboxylate transport system permease small subunit